MLTLKTEWVCKILSSEYLLHVYMFSKGWRALEVCASEIFCRHKVRPRGWGCSFYVHETVAKQAVHPPWPMKGNLKGAANLGSIETGEKYISCFRRIYTLYKMGYDNSFHALVNISVNLF